MKNVLTNVATKKIKKLSGEPYTSRDVRTVWGRGIWKPAFIRRKGAEFLSLLCLGAFGKSDHRHEHIR